MLAWTAQGCCGCACRLAMLAWEQPSAGGCGGCGASICCSYQCHVMLLFLSLPAHSARTIIPIDASIPVNATRCLSQRYSLLFLSLPCAVRALLFPLKLLFLSLPAHSTRNVIPIDPAPAHYIQYERRLPCGSPNESLPRPRLTIPVLTQHRNTRKIVVKLKNCRKSRFYFYFLYAK